jgi:hypothetical protein
MKTSRYVRPVLSPVKWLVGGLMCAGLMANAAPIFVLPNGAVHPPGFVVLLPSPGVGVLPPGVALPPLMFADPVPSPDLHHWELEINNPNPFAMGFNVTFTFPGGPAAGGLFLPPGASMYFDIMYPDVPEISPPLWMVTASSGAAMPGPVLLDTDVLEYPFPTGALPGIGATIPGGPPGAVFGAVIIGAPGIALGNAPVPEPGTLSLLGLGALGLVFRMRRASI